MIKSVTERRKPPMGRRKRKAPMIEEKIEIIKLITAILLLIDSIISILKH